MGIRILILLSYQLNSNFNSKVRFLISRNILKLRLIQYLITFFLSNFYHILFYSFILSNSDWKSSQNGKYCLTSKKGFLIIFVNHISEVLSLIFPYVVEKAVIRAQKSDIGNFKSVLAASEHIKNDAILLRKKCN